MSKCRMKLTALPVLGGLSAIAALGLTPTASVASQVNVTPTSMGNWSFSNADVNGNLGANPTASGGMVTGPATPPLGSGSANLATGNGTSGGDGPSILSTTDHLGTPLSDLTTLSYSTYDTLNNGQQFPWLTIDVALGATINGQTEDFLSFEPPYQTPSSGNPSLPNQGATAMNTWQSWNALTGGWWDSNGIAGCGTPGAIEPGGGGVQSLASCISAIKSLGGNPTIGNSWDGTLIFMVGWASANEQFNGNVDAFTVGINGNNTTYNFDPAPATPLPAALPLFASGLGIMGLLGWRRKRKHAPPAAA